MAKNAIAKLRKEAGLSQQELADAIGAHWTTISRLENGRMELSYEWASKIAQALKCNMGEVFLTKAQKVRAFVAFGLFDKDKFRVYSADGKNAIDIEIHNVSGWYAVEDDQLFPLLQAGDFFEITGVPVADAEAYLGHLCLAVTHKGREFFGFLARGKEAGSFCMRRVNAPDSDDFTMRILAKVATIHPKPILAAPFEPTKKDWDAQS